MNKRLIAERFSKAITTYPKEANVQRQIAGKMIRLLTEHIPSPCSKVINYSGNMLTETAPSVNPQNYSFKEEQPQGATVTAEVKDNQIMIKKLPVDDLIKSIVGEEIGEIIIETLGDIN